MADTTPDFLRGFLVPLGLGSNNVWTAQSTNTVADERAGDPIAQQNNPMQLIAKEDSPERPISQSRLRAPGLQETKQGLSSQTIKPPQPTEEIRKILFPDSRTWNSRHRLSMESFSVLLLWILETEIFSSHTQKRQLLSTEYA